MRRWSATSCARTSPTGPTTTWSPWWATGADYRVELRDVYEGIEERGLDRIVLDLPEPWRVVPHAEAALRSGGILCAYLPTINQTSQLRHVLEESAFGMASTLEVLHRTWHVEDRSVRPDHRMVGHTGFLTTARLLRPEVRPGALGRRRTCGPGRRGRSTDEATRPTRASGGRCPTRGRSGGRSRRGPVRAGPGAQPCSMKMHSPGHSSEASTTASSSSAGTAAMPAGAARLVLHVGALLDVGEAVVEQGEDRGRDLLAEAVSRAEILVDPDLHQL